MENNISTKEIGGYDFCDRCGKEIPLLDLTALASPYKDGEEGKYCDNCFNELVAEYGDDHCSECNNFGEVVVGDFDQRETVPCICRKE